MQQLSEAEASQDGNENLRRHERAPGKGPALFHSANDEWQGGRKNNCQPHMQSFRSHGECGAAINRRNVANSGVGRDHDRPKCAHHDDEQHGGFGLSKPKQRQRTQQTLGSVCNPSAIVPIVS